MRPWYSCCMRSKGTLNNGKSLSNFILLSLEKAADGVVRYHDFYLHTSSYAKGYGRPLKKSNISMALKRLRENGLIDFVDDEKIILRLTDAGKEKAVLAKLLLEDQKWDGRWRIIIFDVPEKRRIVRDILRSKLKTWGFVLWQQSVWATKKNCTKPLRDFINQSGIRAWVKVFEADEVDL